MASNVMPPLRAGTSNRLWRVFANHLATAAAVGATILVMAPLIAIFGYLLYKGASSLNLAFFTQIPKPVGEVGGGMANSILGSGVLLAIASLMGVPIGIAGGIYIAEFGRNKRLANMVRFTADVLNGVPSIVMGIAIYTLIVVPQKHFSALSGGVALGIMMIPTITRTTEEMLLMVPLNVREAALGTGCSELAFRSFDYSAHRVPRRHHRLYAGLCPGCGRDCPVAFYRLREPVLEHQRQ